MHTFLWNWYCDLLPILINITKTQFQWKNLTIHCQNTNNTLQLRLPLISWNFYTKRRQNWDQRENLRQNSACSEKNSASPEHFISPLEVMEVTSRRSDYGGSAKVSWAYCGSGQYIVVQLIGELEYSSIYCCRAECNWLYWGTVKRIWNLFSAVMIKYGKRLQCCIFTIQYRIRFDQETKLFKGFARTVKSLMKVTLISFFSSF